MSAYDDWRRIENAHIRKDLADFKSGDEMSEPKLPEGMDDPVVAACKVSEADEYHVVRDALFARDAQWSAALAASEARYAEVVKKCKEFYDASLFMPDVPLLDGTESYQRWRSAYENLRHIGASVPPEARAVLEGGSRGEDA